MTCQNCGSPDLVFTESRLDDSVVGGKVVIYACCDCLEIVEDVPAEVVDAGRERSEA